MKHIKDYISLFTDWTFLKFIMVGVVNTIVGTTIMFVFYNVFHLSYWVSSASNYFFGSIVSYLLNKNFTFRFRERGLWSLLRFTLNILLLSACLRHSQTRHAVDTLRLQHHRPGKCFDDAGYVSLRRLQLFRSALFRVL